MLLDNCDSDLQGIRYLGHPDSAGQTASNGTLLGVASSRSALAAVLAEDVLCELLILALLAALK